VPLPATLDFTNRGVMVFQGTVQFDGGTFTTKSGKPIAFTASPEQDEMIVDTEQDDFAPVLSMDEK